MNETRGTMAYTRWHRARSSVMRYSEPGVMFNRAAHADPGRTEIRRVILLGERGPIDTLAGYLGPRNVGLEIVLAASLRDLTLVRRRHLRGARLVAFASSVIVPPEVLDDLGYGAYNFHPGPPNYPGVAPQVFAVYEGAKVFGSTAHRMLESVDAGEIVGVETFAVPPGITGKELALRNAPLMFRLFQRLAHWLTHCPDPLPALPLRWSGTKRTRADLARLCDLPPDIDPQDLALRKAAIGF